MASLRWICSKHDKIMELSNCKGNETNEELLDRMSDIYGIADDAKSDGVRMEDGLNEKKSKIKDLENEIESLNSYVNELEEKIKNLEGKQ